MVISFEILFYFSEPVPTILGGPDLYVEEGSTINLTCSIRFGFEPVGHIFWYHESKVRFTIVCKIGNSQKHEELKHRIEFQTRKENWKWSWEGGRKGE